MNLIKQNYVFVENVINLICNKNIIIKSFFCIFITRSFSHSAELADYTDVMITLFKPTHAAGKAQQVGSIVTKCISEISVQPYFKHYYDLHCSAHDTL